MGNLQSWLARSVLGANRVTKTIRLLPSSETTNQLADGRNGEAGVSKSDIFLSKSARKKLAREERMRERKRLRKQERRETALARRAIRKATRDAALAHMDESQRIAEMEARRLSFHADRENERAEKERVRTLLRSGTRYAVCIDLGWTNAMQEKEMKSLAKQIAYSYSFLRKTAEDHKAPMRLSVSGLDDAMEEMLNVQSNGWREWPITVSRLQLLDLHAREDVVYLTHDAEDVLETLDERKVYVVGGLVDRNRLKGATLEKARALGVATARLNLDAFVHFGHGTPVLTVNHCVEILQLAASGHPWQDVYTSVLPSRKGISTTSCVEDV